MRSSAPPATSKRSVSPSGTARFTPLSAAEDGEVAASRRRGAEYHVPLDLPVAPGHPLGDAGSDAPFSHVLVRRPRLEIEGDRTCAAGHAARVTGTAMALSRQTARETVSAGDVRAIPFRPKAHLIARIARPQIAGMVAVPVLTSWRSGSMTLSTSMSRLLRLYGCRRRCGSSRPRERPTRASEPSVDHPEKGPWKASMDRVKPMPATACDSSDRRRHAPLPVRRRRPAESPSTVKAADATSLL